MNRRAVVVLGILAVALAATLYWLVRGKTPGAPLAPAVGPRFDLLATALAQLTAQEGRPRRDADGARGVVELARLQDRVFAATGGVYKHYDFPEPAELRFESDLGAWPAYMGFERAQLTREFGGRGAAGSSSPGVEEQAPAREAEQLMPLFDVNSLRGRIEERERLLADRVRQRFPAPPNGSSRTVWLLETGHPCEAARDAAVREFEQRFPGRARFVRVPLSGDDELEGLIGRRMTAACILGDRVLKDVTRADQWAELLGVGEPLPLPKPTHAELPIFDAHEHVVRGGEERLLEIVGRQGVRHVVVAALPENQGYRGIDEANERVLGLARSRPGVVLPFVILSPLAPDPLADLKRWVAQGARGVKLMSGHGAYFSSSKSTVLDPPAMRAVFQFCQSQGIPILWHVNAHLYGRGLLRVLKDFPSLIVVNPHVGGYLTYAPEAVRHLFEQYPNLFLDFSFGTQPLYLRRGFEDLSMKRDAWRRLIVDHPDRFLFGIDMVVGNRLAPSHAAMLYRLYRSLLEDEHFDLDFFPLEGFARPHEESHHRKGLQGLALPAEVLRRIYWENPMRLYGAPASAVPGTPPAAHR